MRFVSTIAAVTCVLTLSAAPLVAQGRGNGQAKKTTQTAKAPKTTGAGNQTTKQTPKADTRATKTAAKTETRAAKAETRAAKAETRAAKAETRAAKTEAKGAKKAGTTVPTTADVTPTTPTTTHVKNPKLEARLLAMLPPGSNIVDASAGFKNWGQFVAATHVSTNLGIPFADLKAAMTGIPVGSAPGTLPTLAPMSLGQAVQTLKGTATAPTATDPLTTTQINQEVKKAEDAANADLRRTRERS